MRKSVSVKSFGIVSFGLRPRDLRIKHMIKMFAVLIFLIVIILSFMGVEPLAGYKDSAFHSVSAWWSSLGKTESVSSEDSTAYPVTISAEAASTKIGTTYPTLPDKEDTFSFSVIFNEYRESKGLHKLWFSDDLNRVAALRLEEIKRDYSHNSKGGYILHLAENIVKGVSGNRQALYVWKNSYGHNANMLNTEYKYTGYAAGDGYAVQVFSSWETINGEPQLPPGWYWP